MCRRKVEVVPPEKKLGAKKLHLFGFSMTSTLNGEYLLNQTWSRQSGKGVGKCEGSPTLPQNFKNFGPQAAQNRSGGFTHPHYFVLSLSIDSKTLAVCEDGRTVLPVGPSLKQSHEWRSHSQPLAEDHSPGLGSGSGMAVAKSTGSHSLARRLICSVRSQKSTCHLLLTKTTKHSVYDQQNS